MTILHSVSGDDKLEDDKLWNYLLDSCLIFQQKISECIKQPSYRHKYPYIEIRYLMKQTVNDIVSKTLTAMMNEKNIDLCNMFEKLVNKESSEKYEYYKDTIDVMLSTYKYETEMLKTANNLFRNGFHKEYQNHINTSQSAYNINTSQYKICKICDINININYNKRLRLFYCGHLFHEKCLCILFIKIKIKIILIVERNPNINIKPIIKHQNRWLNTKYINTKTTATITIATITYQTKELIFWLKD